MADEKAKADAPAPAEGQAAPKKKATSNPAKQEAGLFDGEDDE